MTYHNGFSSQTENTKLVLDGLGGARYQIGMTPLRKYREQAKLSQAALGRAAGTSQTQIDRLEKGQRKLTKEWAQRLAPALKIAPSRLLFDDDRHIDSEEIAASLDYDDAASLPADRPFPDAIPQITGRMGGGSTGEVITIQAGAMETVEPVAGWWRVPPAALRQMTPGSVENIAAWPMDGDSMEPTIQRTDVVFIDTSRKSIEPDGIWAVDYGLGRTLKRIRVVKTDNGVMWHLTSDNSRYPPEPVHPKDVTVFGRYMFRVTVF